MQVHIAHHDADRTALWGSLLIWIDLAVFQDACLQPAPDQADHARIADAVLHEAEPPFVTEPPKKFFRSASSTQLTLPPAITSLRVAKAWWAPRSGLPPNEQGKKSVC